MGKTVCINCGSTISSGLNECPECGNDPNVRKGKSRSKLEKVDEDKEIQVRGGREKTEMREGYEDEDYGKDSDETKISKAMETLEMIDDETYEIKSGDSSSLIDNIRGLAPKRIKKKDRDPSEETEEKEEAEGKDEERADVDTEAKEEILVYECPLCGAKVEEDADECPGCGAVFEE